MDQYFILAHYFRKQFQKHSQSALEADKTISLLQFEVSLEENFKKYYNSVANIITNRQKPNQKSYSNSKVIRNNHVNSDTKEQIKSQLCTGSHKLDKCIDFKNKSLKDKKQILHKEKKFAQTTKQKGAE